MGDTPTFSNQARAALVVTVLLVLIALVLLPGSVLETLFLRGDPGNSIVLDTVISIASASVPGNVVLAFAYFIAALLTFLIGDKIDSRLWNFVFFISLASLICAVGLYVYAGGTLQTKFHNFYSVSTALDRIPTMKAQDAKLAEMLRAFRTWLFLGAVLNGFVVISMIKNKVFTEFLKPFGISI